MRCASCHAQRRARAVVALERSENHEAEGQPHRADSPTMSGPQTAQARATLGASPSNFLAAQLRHGRQHLLRVHRHERGARPRVRDPGRVPSNRVSEIEAIIDPTTAEKAPALDTARPRAARGPRHRGLPRHQGVPARGRGLRRLLASILSLRRRAEARSQSPSRPRPARTSRSGRGNLRRPRR